MMKKTVLALVAVATLGSASAAFASSELSSNNDSVNAEEALAISNLQATLEGQGLDVDGIEIWGNKFRAFITTDAGIKQAFFDRDTLAPADIGV